MGGCSETMACGAGRRPSIAPVNRIGFGVGHTTLFSKRTAQPLNYTECHGNNDARHYGKYDYINMLDRRLKPTRQNLCRRDHGDLVAHRKRPRAVVDHVTSVNDIIVDAY